MVKLREQNIRAWMRYYMKNTKEIQFHNYHNNSGFSYLHHGNLVQNRDMKKGIDVPRGCYIATAFVFNPGNNQFDNMGYV